MILLTRITSGISSLLFAVASGLQLPSSFIAFVALMAVAILLSFVFAMTFVHRER